MTEGTKYHSLFEHLLFTGHGQTTMSFLEIEAVLGTKLPPSARSREEWWSNSKSGHSQARAWMRAGYSTSRVDLDKGKVTFTLQGWPEGYARPGLGGGTAPRAGGLAAGAEADFDASASNEPSPHATHPDHPLFGIWRGKVKLLPGYDYSAPAFEPDDKLDG